MGRKIVIVGTAYPFRGGLAAYNERLAKAFQQAGDEVIIYTFKLQYPGFLFPGKTQYATWEAPSDLNIKVKVNSINPLNWIKVGREIRKMEPDLVIFKYWIPFMGPCFGTIARIIRKNQLSLIVCIVDNIIPHEKRIGDTLLTKYFVKPIDAFVAMSKSVLNDIAFFDKNKPKAYCPHPLFDNFGKQISRNQALANLGLNDSYSYLLFFGIIRDYKGLDILLEAFSDERLRKFPLKLIVAGEYYSDSKPYDDIIMKYKLHDYIILKNEFIPDSEVVNYFCAADMIVQPYKSATQSGVTQIAYHFNKPMLVTNVGGLGEIVPHQKVGYVVEPKPEEISNALLDFYSNNKIDEFTKNAEEVKKNYSWDRMIETIDKLESDIKS